MSTFEERLKAIAPLTYTLTAEDCANDLSHEDWWDSRTDDQKVAAIRAMMAECDNEWDRNCTPHRLFEFTENAIKEAAEVEEEDDE